MDEFVILDSPEDWAPTSKSFPGMAEFNPTSPDGSQLIQECEPVGSRITCDPPPSETDEDWLVLTSGSRYDFALMLRAEYGFSRGGSELVDDNDVDDEFGFQSVTLGRLNLIITDDEDFYRRFVAASSVAKRLNLLRKGDRIALFQAVLYGNPC